MWSFLRIYYDKSYVLPCKFLRYVRSINKCQRRFMVLKKILKRKIAFIISNYLLKLLLSNHYSSSGHWKFGDYFFLEKNSILISLNSYKKIFRTAKSDNYLPKKKKRYAKGKRNERAVLQDLTKLKNIQGYSVFQSTRSGSYVNVRAETHDKHMRVNGSAAAVCVAKTMITTRLVARNVHIREPDTCVLKYTGVT